MSFEEEFPSLANGIKESIYYIEYEGKELCLTIPTSDMIKHCLDKQKVIDAIKKLQESTKSHR